MILWSEPCFLLLGFGLLSGLGWVEGPFSFASQPEQSSQAVSKGLRFHAVTGLGLGAETLNYSVCLPFVSAFQFDVATGAATSVKNLVLSHGCCRLASIWFLDGVF